MKNLSLNIRIVIFDDAVLNVSITDDWIHAGLHINIVYFFIDIYLALLVPFVLCSDELFVNELVDTLNEFFNVKIGYTGRNPLQSHILKESLAPRTYFH